MKNEINIPTQPKKYINVNECYPFLYKTKLRYKDKWRDSDTFSGIICAEDFDTSDSSKHYLSDIANKIKDDEHFDEKCKENIKNKEKGLS